ncbi:MAG: cation diffusion facilitator family transporter [Candidatus Limnocylindria bacterium]
MSGGDAHDRDHGHAHAGGGGHAHGDHRNGDHGHEHRTGLLGSILEVFKPHSHDAADKVDRALETSDRGIWALKISLIGLGLTAAFQLVIVLISGSVALFADTVHNFSDALTAVPLWIAFALGRRAASRRYTYGFGRAEDLAGIFIVVMIALSAAVAGWESLQRLFDPQPLINIGWVIAAAILGFAGNEAVAVFRIRVGKEIGSAALVADGYHARADGFTSLAVLFGALGVLAGFPIADPIVGLLITVAILFVLRQAARDIWHRLMDAVDPEIVDGLESAAHLYGIEEVNDVRVRWLGHRLEAELAIVVDADLPTHSSHGIGEAVRHALFHAQPMLAAVSVHIDPCGHHGRDNHAQTAHHERRLAQRPAPPGGSTSPISS